MFELKKIMIAGGTLIILLMLLMVSIKIGDKLDDIRAIESEIRDNSNTLNCYTINKGDELAFKNCLLDY